MSRSTYQEAVEARSDLTELPAPELSVVMPCLNEGDTLASCIESAQRALAENNIEGEIIVADNGSTDGTGALQTETFSLPQPDGGSGRPSLEVRARV